EAFLIDGDIGSIDKYTSNSSASGVIVCCEINDINYFHLLSIADIEDKAECKNVISLEVGSKIEAIFVDLSELKIAQ
ncbi:17541_t:CDS:2, partial [Racocetra persica]